MRYRRSRSRVRYSRRPRRVRRRSLVRRIGYRM